MFAVLLVVILGISCSPGYEEGVCNDYFEMYVLIRCSEYIDYLISEYYPEHTDEYIDEKGEDEGVIGYAMLHNFVEYLGLGWTDVEIAFAVDLSVEFKSCPSIKSWDHFGQVMDIYLEDCAPEVTFEEVEEMIIEVLRTELVPGMTDAEVEELKGPIQCTGKKINCDDHMSGGERLIEDFAIMDRCVFDKSFDEVHEDVKALNSMYGDDLIPLSKYAMVADLGFEVTDGMTEYISEFSSYIPCEIMDLEDAVAELNEYGMKCVVPKAENPKEMKRWLNELVEEAENVSL